MKNTYTSSAPRVSVILPVYNGEAFVVDSVKSVLDQDFNDFELIIIDDGSTDGSYAQIKQLQMKDNRIQIISRENRGLIATLNEGVKLARGQWIARMDADDICLANRFSRQLNWLSETKADVCGSWIEEFGNKYRRTIRLPVSNDAIRAEMLFNCPFAHPTMIIRASALKENAYDAGFKDSEDYHLWGRLAAKGYALTNVPEVLLRYRKHDQQVSVTMEKTQQKYSQKSREHYWSYFLQASELTHQDAKTILDMYDPEMPRYDLDAIEKTLQKLIKSSSGEAREVLLQRGRKIYMICAAENKHIVKRWLRFNRANNCSASPASILSLFLLSQLKLKPGSAAFNKLKNLYQFAFDN